MATTEGDVEMSLKLVVNEETNKVLFAEANKDFVDVLFSFLTLPLGTIVRLLEKDSNIGSVTLGSLNSLYHSVENLHNKYMQTETCKEVLLQPRNSSEDYCNTLKLNIDDTDPKTYFICSKFGVCQCYDVSPFTMPTKCGRGNPLTRAVFLKHRCIGFVEDTLTFVITDDLVVMPNYMDCTTTFTVLQNLGIKSLSSVKEITVNVTKEKVLDLLKCCLLSKSSLTGLILEKKPIIERPSILSCNVDVENSSSVNIKLKLVIRKSDGKLLYAQGDKDFADLLLSFLTFPLGGVVRKLGGNCSLGSIDGLYNSISNLNENLEFKSIEAKKRLVDPHLLPLFQLSHQILSILEPSHLQYSCNSKNTMGEKIVHVHFSHSNEINSNILFRKMRLVRTESMCFDGFVKRRATYVATDDLVVAPCSPISVLNLLKRFNTPCSDLKEKIVTIGLKECLGILKASLTSTSALSNGLAHLITEVKEEK